MKALFVGAKAWAIVIIVFLAAVQIERGAFLARHLDTPGSSVILGDIVLFCLVAYWLKVDNRERRSVGGWNMGSFSHVVWPFILPYYLVKTRGLKRTLLTILLLCVVYFGAGLAGVAMFRMGR